MCIANCHIEKRCCGCSKGAAATLPLEVVYNAVDIDVFAPEGRTLDLDQLAGLPPSAAGTISIGLVATFAYWKGHDVFLSAAASLVGPYRFYVVGGPVYATPDSQHTIEELRAKAGELGVLDRLGFTGFIEEVPAAMRALDIVVHASTEPEPFGLVIVQAMACRRAVIVSAAGGACELIEPESNALTYPPGDSAALAQAIQRLAANPALRMRLARAGRTRVSDTFLASAWSKRYLRSMRRSCRNATKGAPCKFGQSVWRSRNTSSDPFARTRAVRRWSRTSPSVLRAGCPRSCTTLAPLQEFWVPSGRVFHGRSGGLAANCVK